MTMMEVLELVFVIFMQLDKWLLEERSFKWIDLAKKIHAKCILGKTTFEAKQHRLIYSVQHH